MSGPLPWSIPRTMGAQPSHFSGLSASYHLSYGLCTCCNVSGFEASAPDSWYHYGEYGQYCDRTWSFWSSQWSQCRNLLMSHSRTQTQKACGLNGSLQGCWVVWHASLALVLGLRQFSAQSINQLVMYATGWGCGHQGLHLFNSHHPEFTLCCGKQLEGMCLAMLSGQSLSQSWIVSWCIGQRPTDTSVPPQAITPLRVQMYQIGSSQVIPRLLREP